jgi:hypothetical protein
MDILDRQHLHHLLTIQHDEEINCRIQIYKSKEVNSTVAVVFFSVLTLSGEIAEDIAVPIQFDCSEALNSTITWDGLMPFLREKLLEKVSYDQKRYVEANNALAFQ